MWTPIKIEQIARRLTQELRLSVSIDMLKSPDDLISTMKSSGYPVSSPQTLSLDEEQWDLFVTMFESTKEYGDVIIISDRSILDGDLAWCIPSYEIQEFVCEHPNNFGEVLFDCDAIVWMPSRNIMVVFHHNHVFWLINFN